MAQDKCFRQFRRLVSPIVFALRLHTIESIETHVCGSLFNKLMPRVFDSLRPDLLSPLAAGSFGAVLHNIVRFHMPFLTAQIHICASGYLAPVRRKFVHTG
jgi:hypothetical protein